MLYCECGKAIEPGRIEAILEVTGELPTQCIECARNNNQMPVGFNVMGGAKGSRKVGSELVVVDPRGNPEFKEHLRQAIRANRRAR